MMSLQIQRNRQIDKSRQITDDNLILRAINETPLLWNIVKPYQLVTVNVRGLRSC